MKRKIEVEKTCATCGKKMKRKRFGGRLEDLGAFKKRRFCSLACANTRTDLTKQGWLWRARRARKKNCEACGIDRRLQVHHADGDITNTGASNLQTLCVWCHRFLHHTAARLGRAVPGKLVKRVLR